jgi:hypothetical protein
LFGSRKQPIFAVLRCSATGPFRRQEIDYFIDPLGPQGRQGQDFKFYFYFKKEKKGIKER